MLVLGLRQRRRGGGQGSGEQVAAQHERNSGGSAG
jgi:hypothetical protein